MVHFFGRLSTFLILLWNSPSPPSWLLVMLLVRNFVFLWSKVRSSKDLCSYRWCHCQSFLKTAENPVCLQAHQQLLQQQPLLVPQPLEVQQVPNPLPVLRVLRTVLGGLWSIIRRRNHPITIILGINYKNLKRVISSRIIIIMLW